MITLSDSSTTITLSDDLFWSDEAQYSAVQQTVEYSITGALLVSSSTKLAGRPITLGPETESSAWMSRSVLDALLAYAAVAGKTMTLSLRGVDYDVMFRHQDAPAIDARPVVHFNDVDPDDNYLITIKLMEI